MTDPQANPYSSPAFGNMPPPPPIGLRTRDYLKAFVVMWLCNLVGGAVVGAIAGLILGFILGAAGRPVHDIAAMAGIAGFIVAIPIQFLFFWMAVSGMIVPKVSQDNSRI